MLHRAETRVEEIDVDALPPGTTVVVETQNSRYRLIVLFDPRVVLMKGGVMFPDATVVRFEGATGGGSALKLGCIVVGFRMEMRLGPLCIRSSPVRSVSIENVPPFSRQALRPA